MCGKGMKPMLPVDREGLPLAASEAVADTSENRLAEPWIEGTSLAAFPEVILADQGYDDDTLRAALVERGNALLAPQESESCSDPRPTPDAAL